jgi:hypothetical protein
MERAYPAAAATAAHYIPPKGFRPKPLDFLLVLLEKCSPHPLSLNSLPDILRGAVSESHINRAVELAIRKRLAVDRGDYCIGIAPEVDVQEKLSSHRECDYESLQAWADVALRKDPDLYSKLYFTPTPATDDIFAMFAVGSNYVPWTTFTTAFHEQDEGVIRNVLQQLCDRGYLEMVEGDEGDAYLYCAREMWTDLLTAEAHRKSGELCDSIIMRLPRDVVPDQYIVHRVEWVQTDPLMYDVSWEGTDPNTGKAYDQSWQNPDIVRQELINEYNRSWDDRQDYKTVENKEIIERAAARAKKAQRRNKQVSAADMNALEFTRNLKRNRANKRRVRVSDNPETYGLPGSVTPQMLAQGFKHADTPHNKGHSLKAERDRWAALHRREQHGAAADA